MLFLFQQIEATYIFYNNKVIAVLMSVCGLSSLFKIKKPT